MEANYICMDSLKFKIEAYYRRSGALFKATMSTFGRPPGPRSSECANAFFPHGVEIFGFPVRGKLGHGQVTAWSEGAVRR